MPDFGAGGGQIHVVVDQRLQCNAAQHGDDHRRQAMRVDRIDLLSSDGKPQALLDLLAKLSVGEDHRGSDVVGGRGYGVGPQHQAGPVDRLQIRHDIEVDPDQPEQFVQRFPGTVDQRIAELLGDGLHQALHQRSFGAEVMGGQTAAVAGTFPHIGQRDPGRSDLRDEFGGRGDQLSLGFAAPLFLRATLAHHSPICSTTS